MDHGFPSAQATPSRFAALDRAYPGTGHSFPSFQAISGSSAFLERTFVRRTMVFVVSLQQINTFVEGALQYVGQKVRRERVDCYGREICRLSTYRGYDA
ncbi:hypothetical protein ACN42_g11281 [Penicillium freii]|uniref:Uncharacterized protein n=1 Tax=Penicillium freii TaxID=48697 RepID=A0A117NKE5_PENFR|nr:hypothetical protein ACN42_g11281 [Penicillium freii]